MAGSGRVHDRTILDALESSEVVSLEQAVWRVTRTGREAIRGSAANGRWSPDGSVEVLYTSFEREGALAEIGFRLALEPVWPSRISHDICEIGVKTQRTLRFADVDSLGSFGIDVPKYGSFDYEGCQALAAAAHFLGFDGLLVPSARHPSHNLVVFMDSNAATGLEIISSEPVDWIKWRSGRQSK